jgi:HEPN domain-containing protein
MSSTYSDQQVQAALKALKAYKEKPFISHEWEELVFRLSRDNDPQLREKMYREMDDILQKDPGFKVFNMY